jgi:hypothetical protein
MKQKDIVMLMVAVVIFLGGGYVAYTQLLAGPTSSSAGTGTVVQVVGSIDSGLNNTTLTDLTAVNPSNHTDFIPKIDLTTGLNNPAPFGP